jgi:hypothetical protein
MNDSMLWRVLDGISHLDRNNQGTTGDNFKIIRIRANLDITARRTALHQVFLNQNCLSAQLAIRTARQGQSCHSARHGRFTSTGLLLF